MIYLEKAKIYKDVIHNSICTTRLANAIIDNRIFQRLRHLHQLGTCFFVFPKGFLRLLPPNLAPGQLKSGII